MKPLPKFNDHRQPSDFQISTLLLSDFDSQASLTGKPYTLLPGIETSDRGLSESTRYFE